MKYRIRHTTRYTYDGPVPIGYNRVFLTPRNSAYQTCLRSQLAVEPVPAVFGERGEDYYGNESVFFTVQEQHTVLEVTARSEVDRQSPAIPTPEATPPWEQVRAAMTSPRDADIQEAKQFAYPVESITVSKALANYALPSFPAGRPVLVGAIHLMNRIYTEFAYDPQATTVSTPVEEILEKRRGVCQDFAHLQIGCMRALGLPARYVSGYVAPKYCGSEAVFVGAQASHAWLSIYSLGDGWVDLDPTNNMLPQLEHITVAWGRNYDEVTPMRGVILGGGAQQLDVDVEINPMTE